MFNNKLLKLTALNGALESSFLPAATSEFIFVIKVLFFVQSCVSDQIFFFSFFFSFKAL